MEKRLDNFISKNQKKRTLKKALSILCIVTLLFTMNWLKFDADTLQRIAACGFEEHEHSADCYDADGNIICGIEEHVHTDACYQERPKKEDTNEVDLVDLDDEEITANNVDEEVPGEITVDLDEIDNPVDDNGDATPSENPENEPIPETYFFSLTEPILLSSIINELPLTMEEVIEVAAVVNGDEEAPIGVEAVDGDWLIYALRDFAEAELAVVKSDDIIVVTMFDGKSLSVTANEVDLPVEEDVPSDEVDLPADEVDMSVEEDASSTREGLPVDVAEDASTENEFAGVTTVDATLGESDETQGEENDEPAPGEKEEPAALEEEGQEVASDGDNTIISGKDDVADMTADERIEFEDNSAQEEQADDAIAQVDGNDETNSVEETDEEPSDDKAAADGDEVAADGEAASVNEDKAENKDKTDNEDKAENKDSSDADPSDDEDKAGSEQSEDKADVDPSDSDDKADAEQSEDKVDADPSDGEDKDDMEQSEDKTDEEGSDADNTEAVENNESAAEDGSTAPIQKASLVTLPSIHIEYDLAEVENYPLSLRAVIDGAAKQEEMTTSEDRSATEGSEESAAAGDVETANEVQPVDDAEPVAETVGEVDPIAETSGDIESATGGTVAEVESTTNETISQVETTGGVEADTYTESPADPIDEYTDNSDEEVITGTGDNLDAVDDTFEEEEEIVEAAAIDAEVREVNASIGNSSAVQTVVEEVAPSLLYDAELLSMEADGEDLLITPIADFEVTDIVYGRYTITLLNGKLAASYPAQTFNASTEYMDVAVTAGEGAFPKGTTMVVSDVDDEDTIGGITDKVEEGFVAVERVHAVDITFLDAEGCEIEPLIPISVVMTPIEKVEEDREAIIVHVDNEGAAEVVEAATEPLSADSSADETGNDDSGANDTEIDNSIVDEEAAANTASVTFEADSFSVYAYVVTKKLETKVLASDGETYKIEVTYGPEAGIPDGAVLAVSEITEDGQYREQVEAGLAGNKMITLARFFDIKIMESEAEGAAEVHPLEAVEVRVTLLDPASEDQEEKVEGTDETAEAGSESAEDGDQAETVDDDHIITEGEPVVTAAHFTNEADVSLQTASEKDDAITFMAEGFSVWGVVYTVDFYYGNYEYHLEGEGEILLSGLFELLGIEADAAEATEVSFTDCDLVAVERVEDDWKLISLMPFDTVEKLTVTMADGTVYEIRVEDALYQIKACINDNNAGYLNSTYLKRSSDNSYYLYASNVSPDGSTNVTRFEVAAGKDNNNASLHYGIVAHANSGYRFLFWIVINHDGTQSIVYNNTLPNTTELSGQTTFVAYFAPENANLIIVQNGDNGSISCTQVFGHPNNDYSLPQYLYSNSGAQMTANPNSNYFFKGWYDDQDNLYSANRTLNAWDFTKDIIIHPVFEEVHHYTFIANQRGIGKFNIPGWSDWYSWSNNTYDNYGDGEKDKQWKTRGVNMPTGVIQSEGISSFEYYVTTKPENTYEFAYWLKDDDTTPFTLEGDDGKESVLRGFSGQTEYNTLERDTTYIAFFKPQGSYVIRVNYPAEGGSTNQDGVVWCLKTVHADSTNRDFHYYYSNDPVSIVATASNDEWVFDGWYNNGTEKLFDSEWATLPMSEIHKLGRDLNLTPVFKRKVGYYNVWFDGTNGINGGDNSPRNTFYSRVDRNDNVLGAKSVYKQVWKVDQNAEDSVSQTFNLPTADEVTKPQSFDVNGYALQGWYEIYTGNYYQPGELITVSADSVFYADWMPASYDIGQNSYLASAINTNSFITTHMFDYNNLFNMASIHLDLGQSSIPDGSGKSSDWSRSEYNGEYWYMNGSENDFIFMYSGAGNGRSIKPYGRDSKNTNNETTTNGTYYSALRVRDLLTDGLRNRLFGAGDGLGKRDLGTGNYLYSYDDNTGYYYYDSDKNAASYNQHDGRFYVYDYTNKTNKSNGGDNTDFLPLNYGRYAEFNETTSGPNYWFGMSSEIKFFLPNPTGFQDENNHYGNQSIKGEDMVYKFAGDDDVWVFVDDQLVLDMGGIHGKIYGEINFSTGEWKVIGNGADKVVSSSTIDYSPKDDNTYILASGSLTGDKALDEGDHTLTLYYLERGSSQSNCAIYFNIAPRYKLQFQKKGDQGVNLGGVKFGIYTNEACTIAADLKNMSGFRTNEFSTAVGDNPNGITHACELIAGRTYYIKELVAAPGYPDMSNHVIKLELDVQGKAYVTVPANAAGMIDTTYMTLVPGTTDKYLLNKVVNQPEVYFLPIVNTKTTSITAQKTWAMLDGSTFLTVAGNEIVQNNDAYAEVQLQRRTLASQGDTDAVKVNDHTVRVITQYFADGNGAVNRDTASCVQNRVTSCTVEDCADLNFNLYADSAGIYSVVASNGDLVVKSTGGSSGPFNVNGGVGYKPNVGSYTLQEVKNDTVIYITYIGSALDVSAIHPSPTASNTGNARWVVEDGGFNAAQEKEKLNKANNWTKTWSDLSATDNGSPAKSYYYYVKEVGGSTTDISGAAQFATAFISTASSDGLSTGTIVVNNTLQSVRVMLRKRDSVKLDGKNVYLAGGKYVLHKETPTGELYVPPENVINSGSMGGHSGSELHSDSDGRFYTGYLPAGTYYLEETEAPDGYVALSGTRQIVVNESGVAWDRNGDGNLYAAPLDDNGYYSLYLNNTMGTGSIKLQKLWRSESTYGLTRAYENTDQSGMFGLDGSDHLYSPSDNGITSVLLSLKAVVDGAVEDCISALTASNFTGNAATAYNIVTVDGNTYIKLNKVGTEWPALTITNLPLKRRAMITPSGSSTAVARAVDIWYFIEEIGYYKGGALYRLADATGDNWTVSYGFENGASLGTGKTETIGSTSRTLIKAKATDPDTLTVTNGFKGSLTFTKKNTAGTALSGATFQIVPSGAGADNFITDNNATVVLTSADTTGLVTIPDLPIGIYWLQEQSAPNGYQTDGRLYQLTIGYPTSTLETAGNISYTEGVGYVFTNPPMVNITIVKIDETTRGNNQTTLTGAWFKLLKDTGSGTENFTLYMPTDHYQQEDDPEHLGRIGKQVDADGSLSFPDLTDGLYQIVETKLPDGYVRSVDNDIYFKVVNGVVTRQRRTETVDSKNPEKIIIAYSDIATGSENEEAQITYDLVDNGSTATFTVGNTPGVSLPSTGGPGTRIFTLLGSSLILLAVVLLVTKRRVY